MIKDVIRISKELIYSQPFYGAVLLSLQKNMCDKTQTASVGLKGIMYRLKIGTDFWNSLSDDHKKGLIIHELGHIVNFHITEYKHLEDNYTANVAKDLYINQTIPLKFLPEGGCLPDNFNVPEGLSTNEYYKLLIDPKNQNQAYKNGKEAFDKGQSSTDDGQGNPMEVPHHEWEEIETASQAVQKMVQKSTEQMLEQVVEQIKKTNPGSIPGGLEEELAKRKIIEPPKFNWKGFVRRFVGTSTKTWTRKTKRKRSKRFRGMPGLRENTYSNILVAIDTSMSVSIKDLEEFNGELIHLHKTGHDIHIVLCDTQIQDEFKFSPNKPLKVTGRGGTKFQPVIDLYNKNLRKYSCLIYLTDGEANSPEDTRGNILWVHGTNHEINEELPGKKVKLN